MKALLTRKVTNPKNISENFVKNNNGYSSSFDAYLLSLSVLYLWLSRCLEADKMQEHSKKVVAF